MSAGSTFKSKLDAVKAEFSQSVDKLKAAAATDAKDLDKRYQQYEKMRQELAEKVIKPRLEEIAAEVPGVQHDLKKDIDGATLTLSFPRTAERAALVELILSISHDDSFKQVMFGYELRIIPVFMEFEKFSKLMLPLEGLKTEAVAAWLDERLLSFMKTYLNMQFVEQYQKENMATDPVLNRRFPSNLAVGTIEHKGSKFKFASAESMAMFKTNPEKYINRLGG